MVVSRVAFLRLRTWRDCVKCVIAQRQLHSRPADRRIARAAAGETSYGRVISCRASVVLAPVTGAGPPQAAETAAARVPPGWSPAPARSRSPCDGPARTCRYVRLLTEGRYLVVSAHIDPAEYMLVPPRVRARIPTRRAASYGHHVADHLQGTCSLRRSAAVRLGLSGAGPQSGQRLGPWMASGLRGALTAASSTDAPGNVSESHTLHARSQVLAMHPAWQTRS